MCRADLQSFGKINICDTTILLQVHIELILSKSRTVPGASKNRLARKQKVNELSAAGLYRSVQKIDHQQCRKRLKSVSRTANGECESLTYIAGVSPASYRSQRARPQAPTVDVHQIVGFGVP